MELLKSGFKSVLGAQQPGAQPSGAETVECLVDRVQSSTLLDDRRDAVRGLKAMSKKFRLEVGTRAMDPLLVVLQTDRNDSEIVGYALDTLCNVISHEALEAEDGQVQDGTEADLGQQFTEIFIKKTENVSTLMSLLEEYDSHVRWPAVRLLTCLLINKPRDLQEVILVIPSGVPKLMDLLADSREFIRNDALLLLTHLTKSHANIQKIVAFENAFDRLLDIFVEEGNSDGGIIVEDCLILLLNLLKNNTSNQTFFKEGSFIQRLMPFFTSFNDTIEGEWSAQKVININLMLQVVRTLVSPSNPLLFSSSCQKIMYSCGLLEQLCHILMASGVPADILTETINTVSEVIRGNHTNQEYFSHVTAPSNPPRPAIVVLLMSMVNDRQPFILRCAVLYCFQSFLYKNELGQAQIIQTFFPACAEANTCTTGQLLCGGLFSLDALSTWCAAVALSHALVDNGAQKEQLLRVQLATSIGTPPVSLLQHCTSILQQQGSKVQTRVGLLMLLSTWLSNCPLAVTHFVTGPTNVPYLTSQVGLAEGDDQECLIQGICAFLLGICIQFNDDSVPSCSKDALCQLIAKRIGLETYLDKLGRISKHESYSRTVQKPQPNYDKPTDVVFDYEFCRLFKSLEGGVIKAVAPKPKDSLLNGPESNLSEAQHSLLAKYKTLIRDQDIQINELRVQFDDLKVEHNKSSNQIEEMSSTLQQLRDQNALLKAHRGNQQANADATKDVDDNSKKENEALKKETESLQSQLEEKQQLIENLQSQLNQRESSPPDLAAAFSVDGQSSEQIKELKNQIGDLQNKLATLEEENKSLKLKLEDANTMQTTNDELQKEIKTLTKEQDDLLVLLTDQDTKITNYKSRLRELGQAVSDHDDDDDDDDDFDEKDGLEIT